MDKTEREVVPGVTFLTHARVILSLIGTFALVCVAGVTFGW